MAKSKDKVACKMMDLMQNGAGLIGQVCEQESENMTSGKRFAARTFAGSLQTFVGAFTDEVHREMKEDGRRCDLCDTTVAVTYSIPGIADVDFCETCYKDQMSQSASLPIPAAAPPSRSTPAGSTDEDGDCPLPCSDCNKMTTTRYDLGGLTLPICAICFEAQALSADVPSATLHADSNSSSNNNNLVLAATPTTSAEDLQAASASGGTQLPLTAACPPTSTAMAAHAALHDKVDGMKATQEKMEITQQALLDGQADLCKKVDAATSEVHKQLDRMWKVYTSSGVPQEEQYTIIQSRLQPQLDEALATLRRVAEQVDENQALSVATHRQLTNMITETYEGVQVLKEQQDETLNRLESLPEQMGQIVADEVANAPARGARQPMGRGR